MNNNVYDFEMHRIARDESLLVENAPMDIWLAEMDGCSVYTDNMEMARLYTECPDREHQKCHWLKTTLETKVAFELYSSDAEFDAMVNALNS